nr:ABC transporter substrate-binding protein [uncultured Oscillibacter sp.]
MKRKRLAAPLCALLLLLAGCGAEAPETAAYAPAEEERLVIYTSHKEEVYQPIVKEFEERTGIWVDVVAGGTNELLERIRSEADHPAADVMFGGGVESLASYRDCFAPYACEGAESIEARFRDGEDLWTPFSALPVVLVYNTKLVRPGRVTGWGDLLSPELRGRIAFADPAVSGSGFTALATFLLAADGGEEALLRAFAENLAGKQLEGSGEVLGAVAGGGALVGVTLEETALKRIAAGDDVALVYPADGTSCVPDASALIRGAAHEENAKAFLDFTVSEAVQRLLAEQFCRRSVRGDVEPAGELPALEDIALVDYDVEQASGRRDGLLMTWAFYLGEEEEK